MQTRRSTLSAAFAAAFVFATAQTGLAETPINLTFMTHAAFFSHEMNLKAPIDPQVFVKDAASKAAKGPQNIEHIDRLRPAKITQDAKSTPVYDAQGKPLGFTLGSWLGATGSVTIAPSASGAKMTASFKGLIPNGHYSIFENHFDQKPVGFTPMDGTGTKNNFVAGKDGIATIRMPIPAMPTHANAVLLVYHSDGQDHGTVRGQIGIDAHHQLIARP
ncbi:MAG: hypothetical protein KGH84_12355 [Paracoccaceae bacterium]|nr:hypothetical protein [Paracoccaceae bacterium]